MFWRGPTTIAVNFQEPMVLVVRCLDAVRGTFVDIVRDRGAGHREVLNPGDAFECVIAPGPVDVSLGHCTDAHFESTDGVPYVLPDLPGQTDV